MEERKNFSGNHRESAVSRNIGAAQDFRFSDHSEAMKHEQIALKGFEGQMDKVGRERNTQLYVSNWDQAWV